jgi:hypothetical protein
MPTKGEFLRFSMDNASGNDFFLSFLKFETGGTGILPVR